MSISPPERAQAANAEAVQIPSIKEIKERILRDCPCFTRTPSVAEIRKRILTNNPTATEEDVKRLWSNEESQFKYEAEQQLFKLAQAEQLDFVRKSQGGEAARIWSNWADGNLTL